MLTLLQLMPGVETERIIGVGTGTVEAGTSVLWRVCLWENLVMRSIKILLTLCLLSVFAVAAAPVLAQQTPIPEAVAGTSAATCGASSGNFGRICRPGSNKRCLSAVKRGVKGFTRAICIDRREACETCLGRLQRCFRTQLDLTTPVTKKQTCDRCEIRYTACMRRLYPGYSK
jgi:hypothetical protein